MRFQIDSKVNFTNLPAEFGAFEDFFFLMKKIRNFSIFIAKFEILQEKNFHGKFKIFIAKFEIFIAKFEIFIAKIIFIAKFEIFIAKFEFFIAKFEIFIAKIQKKKFLLLITFQKFFNPIFFAFKQKISPKGKISKLIYHFSKR